MRKYLCTLLTVVLAVAAAAPAVAGNPVAAKSTSERTLTLGDRKIEYTSITGLTVMTDDGGKAKAEIFSVTYLGRSGHPGPGSRRPVSFVFNGGPGSSSVWLHLGGLGPRRVVMEPEGWKPPPPYRIAANEETWLGFTDLVFIDPVNTGFSRAAKGENPKQFFGLHEDARSVADFIRKWLTEHGRWDDPIYLVGESYGTTRAAQLSVELAGRGIDLSGIILVSPILNFQTTDPRPGNDLGYWLFLPTMAATARYHGVVKTEGSLTDWLDEVETFAETEYLTGLAKGTRLAGEERRKLAEKLAHYTGLGTDFVLASNLRIGPSAFRKELLRHGKGSVGRLDSRFAGADRTRAGSRPDRDPSMDAIRGPFTATMNDYLAGWLRYKSARVYEIMGGVHPWKMGPGEHRYANVAESLGRAMRANPHLKVLCAMGYYDFATPYFAAEYTMSHLGWPALAEGRVSFAHYESGHMMYIRDTDRRKLTADAALFYGVEKQ